MRQDNLVFVVGNMNQAKNPAQLSGRNCIHGDWEYSHPDLQLYTDMRCCLELYSQTGYIPPN